MLDVHVTIFQIGTEDEIARSNLLADLIELRHQLLTFVSRNQTNIGQHPGMSLGSTNVHFRQSGIKTDRFCELFYAGIRGSCKTSAPSFCRHGKHSCLVDSSQLDSEHCLTGKIQ